MCVLTIFSLFFHTSFILNSSSTEKTGGEKGQKEGKKKYGKEGVVQFLSEMKMPSFPFSENKKGGGRGGESGTYG